MLVQLYTMDSINEFVYGYWLQDIIMSVEYMAVACADDNYLTLATTV